MADATGRRYRVRVIRAGLSLNGNFYSDDALRRAVPQFNKVRVFVKSDLDHLRGAGKDVRNLIGRIVNAAFVAGAGPDSGEVQADLELIEPEGEIGSKIAAAFGAGMSDLFGFSIDAMGHWKPGTIGGKSVRIATEITAVRSLDLIVEPSAGGRVIDLLEAAGANEGTVIMNREQLIDLLKQHAPHLLEGKDPNTLSDAELMELAGQAMGGVKEAKKEVAKAERMRAAEARIGRTSLPDASKRFLVSEMERKGDFTEADLDAAIKAEIARMAPLARRSGRVTGLGDTAVVELIEGRDEKVSRMLDAFFDPNDRSVVSIRECYLEITGDKRFTGMVRECDQMRLREALGSESWGDALGNAVTRRMVAEYNTPDVFDVWRDMVTIANVNDFRVQERTRVGGYGDLPKVAEREPYVELASPNDEKATYAVEKRGGTETVTLEMIANDDANAVRGVPLKLARAAKRTLSRFVLMIPASNPEIYDGKTLFHVDHGNLGTAALSSPAVGAGRLAIKNQREPDSNEKLSIPARYLWVPDDLEETAFNLFRRSTNVDADFIQSLQLEVRPVWCWTDTADWMLTAQTRHVPFIELGFFGGQEDPELFIQDSPTAGSMFANDTLTYKVRHIYGGTVVDYRGAYKSVVA